MMLIQEDTSSW